VYPGFELELLDATHEDELGVLTGYPWSLLEEELGREELYPMELCSYPLLLSLGRGVEAL
jgi:hypothetical protein